MKKYLKAILGFLDSKKIKLRARCIAGILYLVVGILFFKLFITIQCQWEVLVDLFNEPIFLWCIFWSSFGIGAGLINTRDHDYINWWTRHVLYCGFILLLVTLISFVIPLYIYGPFYKEFDAKFYSLSALIGLIGGFLVDIFRSVVLKFLDILKPSKVDK